MHHKRPIGWHNQHFIRLTAEITDYAEAGAKILIENGWMEQPPLASDRDKLTQH
ncbi:DUF3231 family protein [Paenibacillus psychroresistens]|uniref:DUF3231 family protein n=1 Tax=Paenibacillus psychroresistens TaxID=1778678 RepID=A0A6B8RKU2_9BACL|nr:DUF3231 family protein [Paenibacillus psychroresistens]QGQ96374.1 DUF3231 family protein [Paenibacillus psychroresistens]